MSGPPASSPVARTRMRANRRRDTTPEIALRRELHRRGFRFRVDYPIRVEGMRPIRADIAFPRKRIAVFVDGCFWHGCPAHGTEPKENRAYWTAKIARNRERDYEQGATLRTAGWQVLRLWEHLDVDEAADQVANLVGRSSGVALA